MVHSTHPVTTSPECANGVHPLSVTSPVILCLAIAPPVPGTGNTPTPIGGQTQYQGFAIVPAARMASQSAIGIPPLGEHHTRVIQSGRGAQL